MRSIHPLKAALVGLCLLALTPTSRGQITEVGTAPENLYVIRSLPTAGVKLYSWSETSVTLYNLDLSVYTTIDFPPLPEGHMYHHVWYFTENTFDTDPLTIELLIPTWAEPFVQGTRVIRDDGTILLDELGLVLGGGMGHSEVNAKPPLFTGEDGQTYMVLVTNGDIPPPTSHLYRLPGSLPCMDCAAGSGMGFQPDSQPTDEGAMVLFPNPATSEVTVTCTLPPGTGNARLLVQDALGKLVSNLPMNPSGRMSLDLTGRAAGTYTCSLVTDGRVLRSIPLVVAH